MIEIIENSNRAHMGNKSSEVRFSPVVRGLAGKIHSQLTHDDWKCIVRHDRLWVVEAEDFSNLQGVTMKVGAILKGLTANQREHEKKLRMELLKEL